MELNQRQFEMLVLMEASQDKRLTQRTLAKELDVSLGLVNKVLGELLEAKLICVGAPGMYRLEALAYTLLEPHRVKRAIFFAAGFGERLMPLTKTTAKSLIEIQGVRIIDRTLDALIAQGIEDIIIVRGYLKEQFDVLLEKYPAIRFVDNDQYAVSKNITSAYLVKDCFANAYIFEADILLMNPALIQKYEFSTHYKSVEVAKSDIWCFEVVAHRIKNYTLGGINVDEMMGISYWSQEDAVRLSKDIDITYHGPAGKERFWDDVALTFHKDNYSIAVRRYNSGDVVELRSLEQLLEIDKL